MYLKYKLIAHKICQNLPLLSPRHMPAPSSSEEFIVYHGTVIHSLGPTDLEINENAVLVVNVANGTIVDFERNVEKLNEYLCSVNVLQNKHYSVS
jgi:hypothetical protein